MAVIAVTTIAIGGFGTAGARTLDERVESVATTIKCPTCRSQSAGDSDAPASIAIREEIRRRLQDGQSADEIREYFASRYGQGILLTPSGSGVGALVWALPVAALVVAASGIGWAFVRWRRWET